MRTPARSTAAERAEAVEHLRRVLPPGSTVYTVLRHRSASGMSRAIALYSIRPDPDERSGVAVQWVTWWAAVAMRERWSDRHEAITVSGAGMDMGFHLAYNLSSMLYRDGWQCLGDRCPSSVHQHPDHPRDGTATHTDGYALRHEWL